MIVKFNNNKDNSKIEDYFDVDKTIEQFDDNGNMIYCELNDTGVIINQHFKNGNLIYNVKNFYEKDRNNRKILNLIVATHYEYDDYNNIVKQDVYKNGILLIGEINI